MTLQLLDCFRTLTYALGIAVAVPTSAEPTTLGAGSLRADAAEPLTETAAPETTPAETKIEAARVSIKATPENYQPHNELAMALARRARESGNPELYDEATTSLNESFRLAPENLEGRRVEIWLLLGKHQFSQALDKARALNKSVPDDTMCYALLADAAIETGHYEEAEKAVQWSFDLRPGEIAGLTRGAYLRELFGDHDGAIEFMNSAYQRTALTEVEDRAWMLVQLTHLLLLGGKTQLADEHVAEALRLFPKYHYALAAQAQVRTAQKRLPEAVDILREHFMIVRSTESVYALAKALQLAGDDKDAAATFAFFERMALEESNGAHNHNRDLIFYYVDHASKPAEALRLATREIEQRQDVKTLDAHAWALFANGDHDRAAGQLEKALAVGVRDPVIFYHAGCIAVRRGDHMAAEKHFLASLAQSPDSEVGGAVRRCLAELRGITRAETSDAN